VIVGVLYVTSNRERPEFEEKIKASLLTVIGDRPLVSVSQQPINFGRNICVGDIGHSYYSAFRQMVVGAESMTEDYVAIAESDQLYPPDYFTFEPAGEDLYLHDSVYVIKSFKPDQYQQKRWGDWISVVKREYLIACAKSYLSKKKTRVSLFGLHGLKDVKHWKHGLPVVSFKTRQNVSLNTETLVDTGEVEAVAELPYWGKARDLFRKYVK